MIQKNFKNPSNQNMSMCEKQNSNSLTDKCLGVSLVKTNIINFDSLAKYRL